MFDTIVASGITSGLVAAAFTWLAKTWLSERLKQSIQHEYATLLEAHKTTLKAEADMKLAELQAGLTAANTSAIERLKADLQVAAAERQLRFKHIYDREAEAIAETYENLSDLRSKVVAYVSIMETSAMGTRTERRDAVNAAMSKFTSRFRLHRLYLPRPMADAVHSFVRALSRKAIDFNVRIDINDTPDHDSINTWTAIDEFMEKEAPRLFDELEREFRRRLGQEEMSGEPMAASHGARA
ncbi:hypothetical protein [Sorangium sp. So ce145]|uniref:hypothetical protein n=1 Tax=Sorangium sp. So ce145 TaxID=3133285 RepID=UPI003F5FD4E1